MRKTLLSFLEENAYVSKPLQKTLMTIADATVELAKLLQNFGLHQLSGKTGTKNVHGDDVERLDAFADSLLTKKLLSIQDVFAVMSEELAEPQMQKMSKGSYIVCFDPLDGSSNIDVNLPIGTIFSLYESNARLLQYGNKQIAAGYALYGPSTLFILAMKGSVHAFTLDPKTETYLLTLPDIRIPKHSHYYAVNEGNYEKMNSTDKKYLDVLKKKGTYKLRNCGAMVADIHRTLLKGGIFLYPADKEHQNGKLRLLFEVNPMSYIIEQAGGSALSGKNSPLDILPSSFHEHAPIVIGSKGNVDEYVEVTLHKDD